MRYTRWYQCVYLINWQVNKIHALISMHICDWIWESVHSSHIRFCSFGDPQKSQGMVYGFETFRNDEEIVIIQSLKVSHLSIIPTRFYEFPKLKNWMCELCTFSQIQSHISLTFQSQCNITFMQWYFPLIWGVKVLHSVIRGLENIIYFVLNFTVYLESSYIAE